MYQRICCLFFINRVSSNCSSLKKYAIYSKTMFTVTCLSSLDKAWFFQTEDDNCSDLQIVDF